MTHVGGGRYERDVEHDGSFPCPEELEVRSNMGGSDIAEVEVD